MLLKRGVAEDVYATALQRLSDRAKAGLPEPQCPGVERSHPSVARLYADARDSSRLTFSPGVRLDHGPMANEAIQGHKYGAYVALHVLQ